MSASGQASDTPAQGRYRLIGGNGSPYSQKLRAIMRYRRLPFDWIPRTERNVGELAHIKPALIPVLQYPEDGSSHIDTTPIAYALEQRHPGQRSIVPDDPGHAFLSHLIEDMADEWLTKAMFHYRWAYDADIRYAGFWIADDFFPDRTGKDREAAARSFADRQINRMPLVGCTAENAPIIEASYHRILALLEGHVGMFQYLFGSRPALADFGLFAQLYKCLSDPTAGAIMQSEAPLIVAWCERMLTPADSGEFEDWGALAPTLAPVLSQEVAGLFLPWSDANARALAAGEPGVSLPLDGQPYAQEVQKYHARSLQVGTSNYLANFVAL